MKKKFAKILSLLLVALISCSAVVACDDTPDNTSNSTSSNTSSKGEQPDLNEQKVDIKLVDNSRSDYKIVIPVDATDGLTNAANELKSYLTASTGAQLQIIDDSAVTLDGKYISIGQTELFEESGMTVSDEELNRDGYKIKRFGNSVVICGANDLGCLYGVYEFLSYQIGWEAFASTEIYYRKDTTVYLNDFNLVESPDFSGRTTDGPIDLDMYGGIVLRYRAFNQSVPIFDYNGGKTFIPGHSETFMQLIPRGTYNDPKKPETYHPEWFMQSSVQMCLTNEELIEETIKNTIAAIEANPYGRYVNISQNDGAGYCECENCKWEWQNLNYSGHIIRFVNKVIEAVEEWRMEECPERELTYQTFAYAFGVTPPTRFNVGTGKNELLDPSCKPHEKLGIRFVRGSEVCLTHAIDNRDCAMNKKFYDAWEIWKEICSPNAQFTLYDYCANYSNYLSFTDYFTPLKTNLQHYKKIGINDIFVQNATGTGNVSLNALHNYLLSKLLWDVDEDVDALVDKFMTHYYKEAAPYMKNYFYHMVNWQNYLDATRNGGFHIQTYMANASDIIYWPVNVVNQAMGYLQQALDATQTNVDESLHEALYTRVLSDVCCVKFLIVKNYGRFYVTERDSANAFLDQWLAECARCNVTSTIENPDKEGGTVEKVADALRATLN